MFDVSLAPQRFGNGMDRQIAPLWPMQFALATSCTLVSSSCQARRDAVRRIAILVATCKSRCLARESTLFPRAAGCSLCFFPCLKMGMCRPGPDLASGSMTSRPVLRVMGRSISPKCYGFDDSLGIMGRPKYFSIILNHEYYEHF